MSNFKIGDIISPNEEELNNYPITYKDEGLYWKIYDMDDMYYRVKSIARGFKWSIHFNKVLGYNNNKVIAIW